MVDPRILSRLVYFTTVVETQSFTKAAERLGITKAVVSQQVARLEENLGTALLVRTTRRVEPTEAGRLLHIRASAMLREAGEAVEEAAQGNHRPRGTLRILAPADYGALRIVPVIADFLRRYPECRADLRLGDRITDLFEGEIDLSIRVGWLTDSSLHARRLGTFEQVLVAAPSLVARLEGILSPDQLADLPLIVNTALPQATDWHFTGPTGEQFLLDARAVLSVDTARGVHAAVLAGLGLGILPDFMAAADIERDRLIPVLPDWRLPGGGIHAVYASSRLRPTRVSAFVDMLVSSMKGDPPRPAG